MGEGLVAHAKATPVSTLCVLTRNLDLGENAKTPWLPEILPRQYFTEICQKVYFSVDDYSEIDFILANGYLSYTFFEHVAISGREDYFEHCRLCRMNVEGALSRLPLLLPATMDVIAALTLGVRLDDIILTTPRTLLTFTTGISSH